MARPLPLRRLAGAFALAALIPLGGCASYGDFEPSSMLDFLNSKKPLPGERRPVFPEGVPGVQQGVPPELMKGANHPGDNPPDVVTAAPEPPPPQPVAKQRKSASRTAKTAAKPARRAAPPPPPQEPDETAEPAPAQ